jgi:hypothetical protein
MMAVLASFASIHAGQEVLESVSKKLKGNI